MSRNMRKILTYIALASLLTLVSCDAWLDVKPYDKMSQDELFSTEAGFIKSLNGIYIELNSDMLYGGALSVEMVEIMGGAYVIGTDNSVWGNYADLAIVEAIELESEIYAIGFKKNSDLTAKVNAAIKTLEQNGKLKELAVKYKFENVLKVIENIEF